MRKFVSTLLVVLVTFVSFPLHATVPVCVLGGATAMDTNRQLAEGETFVKTDRPLVVNLRFRPTKERPEQVGECMLPSGTVVAVKNGILQWVKACGNDEVNRNVFVTAFTPLRGLPGRDGLQGLKGDPGEQGPKGDPAKGTAPKGSWYTRAWKKHPVITGIVHLVVIGGITAVASSGGNEKKNGPIVHTDPPN